MNQRSITCPICSGSSLEPVAHFQRQPVLIGALWEDRDAARSCKKGDISLVICADCGFVWNEIFDPDLIEYDQQYDNSLHFSPTFQAYSRELVARLVSAYDLNGKTIVDIGCGKGDFLRMLAAAGSNKGFGFDPSFDQERDPLAENEDVVFVTEYYGEEHGDIDADLISSRFVLEHIPEPLEFLRMIGRSVKRPDETTIFCEVPNIDLILRQGSVWDIIYEHFGYFSVPSLKRAFVESGFEPITVHETYAKQYLTIDARSGTSTHDAAHLQKDIDALLKDAHLFRGSHNRRIIQWQEQLSRLEREGRNVVAWGAGAKAVAFLNMIPETRIVNSVVDINPHKAGRHLSGTGQEITKLDALRQSKPDTVIIMNPVYRDEIQMSLSELDLEPELIDV